MKRFLQTGLTAGAVLSTPLLASADTVELTGVIRDFQVTHPDMETYPGTYNKVAPTLNENGKPQLDMNYYYAKRGTDGQSVYSPDSFAQWFTDVPDVNIAIPFSITLDNGQDEPGGVYTFAREKQMPAPYNYFFPIDDQGFGLTYPVAGHPLKWASGGVHNFHFTYEMKTTFSYSPGQVFKFVGDDDVWVYVGGNLVVDLGGVHSQESSSVLLMDGKAFVASDFPGYPSVQTVSSDYADKLSRWWSRLNLPGDCPVRSGDKYVDLQLNGESNADVRAEFHNDGDSVTVFASRRLSSIIVKLASGAHVQYDGLSGYNKTIDEDQPIVGVWVKAGNDTDINSNGYGRWLEPAGSDAKATLDLFFAERHTSESNFRIETTLVLEEVAPGTVSPLYD